ncbi:DUF6232 family protein [Kordiimonas laminariae]|uniref:DUF6232 family protein n=1 Tax=Kordiimonas laminariae TaxID=2917717 RepID=UPI001FF1DCEE|nr:DUF6232 family protein [Kordiimonas laminariae]MCK0069133.1 DUF6232 family protein [Kordiimonas laminariae]
MEEKVFFDSNNVSVSNSRFIVSGQTYAMSNVTSVKTGTNVDPKAPKILIIIIGLITTAFSAVIGLILIAVGIAILMSSKDSYSVILSTAAGENQALTSDDKNHIEKVVAALNEAIISRG